MRIRYAAALAVLLAVLGTAPAASAVGQGSKPTAARFAPYVDLGDGPPALLQRAIRRVHLRSFTAAFVLGDGCTPVWDDGVDTPVAADPAVATVIRSAQRSRVKVVVSFGGAAQTELALSCAGVKRLTAAYASVIRRFSLTNVDFNIEGPQLTDPASIVRRFHAIHALEHRDHHLVVSLPWRRRCTACARRTTRVSSRCCGGRRPSTSGSTW
jgi:hypothetical protein